MITLLTIFHVIVCIFLILVVLLQQGKSADFGAFGGGSSQASFGSRGSGTVLSKATTAASVIFMLTSLALTILISRPGSSSVIREGAKTDQPQQSQPAEPAKQTPAPQDQSAPAQTTPAPPATPEKK